MKSSMTPQEIVSELDRYIVGQNDAKRAVAIALRNRWRRQSLPTELRDEVAPKNIIMIGPTGVGKTEIARRLDLPFFDLDQEIRGIRCVVLNEGVRGRIDLLHARNYSGRYPE